MLPRPTESVMLRLRWLAQPQTLAYFALWLALLGVGSSKLFRDPGTFWHTALGEQWLNQRGLDRTDTFTFTRQGQTWLPLQWLGEITMALAWRCGGFDAQLACTAGLLAALYAWLYGRMVRGGMHWLLAALGLLLVLAASAHHFHVRPHLATIAGMGLLAAVLCDVEAGRASIGRLGWLTPLLVVWTNMHAGVLGGIFTLELVIALWLLRGLAASCRQSTVLPARFRLKTRGAVFLAALMVLAPLTLLVNPFGWELLGASWRIMAMPLPDLIDEHRRLDLRSVEGMGVLTLGCAYLLVLADVWRQERRMAWLAALPWLVLAFLRVRHAPLFAIVAGISIADMLPHSRLAQVLAVRAWFFPLPGNAGTAADPGQPFWAACAAWLAPVLALAAALGIQAAGWHVPLVGRGWARLDTTRWPVGLAGRLRELGHDHPGTRLVNVLDYGGFVVFHAPGIATFCDDRCELFGAQFLAQSVAMENERPDVIQRVSEAYDARWALVRRGSPLDAFLAASDDWQFEQRDAAAVLYRRP